MRPTSAELRWVSLSKLLLSLLTLLPLFPATALNSDGSLLLSFKYSILGDPLSVLADWSYADESPCTWNGITCIAFPPSNWTANSTADYYRVISLVLPNSQLLGSIPFDLGLVQHIRHIDLSGNYLNGSLPVSLFNHSELRVLDLPNNDISGGLPEIAAAGALSVINLSDNALVGEVPGSLSRFPNLTVLSLANNYLSGELSGGGFDRLEVLDLSSNLVNGTLPQDLAGGTLRYLNLSYNRLAGEIPPEFGSRVPAGAVLDLSFNNLTGEIPQTKAFLSQKAAAFVGNSDLCGRPMRELCAIPSMLSDPPPNVSSAAAPQTATALKSPPAIAAIPRNPEDSPGTGAASGSGLTPVAIAAITVGDLGGIGLLFIVFFFVYQAKKKKKQHKDPKGGKLQNAANESNSTNGLSCCLRNKAADGNETSASSNSSETEEEDKVEVREDNMGDKSRREAQQQRGAATLVTVDGETELELETLLKASAYILGATASSIVYKAVLADGTVLAVRRIGENGGVEKLKDFDAQVRSVARLRHPNLLPLRGFYWGPDEKLIIHDFAPNGSLANITFTKKLGSSPISLSWDSRLRIVRGAARGLAYIHEKKSVHGNFKPGNILLGPDMEPLIGDLGLDRLTSSVNKSARHFSSKRSNHSHSSLPELSQFAGIGPCSSSSGLAPTYQAPESLRSLKPSSKWDVYSFGVVLLELLTGRLIPEAELAQWNAGFALEERGKVLRMVDPGLRREVEGKEEALLACFRLGFACGSIAPQRRPSMKDAVQVLERISS